MCLLKATAANESPCRAKGKSCDVLLSQQNQGRACRVSLLQHAASPCTAHGTMPLNSGPFAAHVSW